MRRYKNVARKPRSQRSAERFRIRNHKSKSVAMHSQPPRNQILVGSSLWQSVTVGFILNQRTAAHEPAQQPIKLPTFRTVQPKLPHQLLEPSRPLRLPRNMFEDDGIGEH